MPASAQADDHGRIAQEFVKALGSADLEVLKKMYADNVILMAGSELLKDEWGLVANGPRDKDALLAREKLIEGYGNLIARIGKEKWQALFGKLDTDRITTATLAEDRPPFLKKGDLTVSVRPGRGDDTLTYHFRKSADGKWLVVAEKTDY
ncbi:MAG: hypothetical protein ACE15C_04815 [Phycisphaerae bacterium]